MDPNTHNHKVKEKKRRGDINTTTTKKTNNLMEWPFAENSKHSIGPVHNWPKNAALLQQSKSFSRILLDVCRFSQFRYWWPIRWHSVHYRCVRSAVTVTDLFHLAVSIFTFDFRICVVQQRRRKWKWLQTYSLDEKFSLWFFPFTISCIVKFSFADCCTSIQS